MEPYQKATEEVKRQGEAPLRLVRNAVSGAVAAGGTTALLKSGAGKVLSLVNKYVPDDLSIKGLTKLDPRFGKFIQTALSAGASYSATRDFISEKASEGEEKEEPSKLPQEDRNLIQKYSPELHQFIMERVQGGDSPLQAGAVAQNDSKRGFKKIIDKIVKDNKVPWSAILDTVYGSPQSAQPQQQGQNSEVWDRIASGLKNIMNS